MRLIDADALKKDDELTEWKTRDAIRTGKMLKAFSELFIKKIDECPTVCDCDLCKFNTKLMLIEANVSGYAQGLKESSKTGHWILQPSNKKQGERDFIWWKCSECGQVIFSETEKDRRECHAFCGRCGVKMVEPQESEESE